jgi:hypothetical protein
MAEKSRTGSRSARMRTPKLALSPIPEPFQLICASTVTAGARKIKIPMLVLRGEWLKAVGFPVGAPLYLACDRRGEIVLQRLGLRLPRTLRIVAKCQRPGALGRTSVKGGGRRANKG